MEREETLTESLVGQLCDAYDSAAHDSAARDRLEDAAARLLVDHWACALAGRPRLPDRWRPGAAPLAAAAAHALDRDDIHWDSFTHPGSVIWPVVLVLGEQADAAGAATLRAATLGYEVVARLAGALGPSHRRHWHSTATAGTVGAAMSAAVLLGLDRDAIVAALGHATSVAAGSSRCLIERSGTKLFHRAHAVRSGIDSAQAAAAGLPATRFGLEEPDGMLTALSAAADASVLLAPVQRWAIEDTGVRPYAVNGFAHAAMDAALPLHAVFDGAAIERVRLDVSAAARRFGAIAIPATDEDAWWSVQHAVAVCLVHGDPAALEGGVSSDPRVRALLERIEISDQDEGLGATVTVTLSGGESVATHADLPTGHARQPLTDVQLLAKWRALTGGAGDRALHAARTLGSQPLREVIRTAGVPAPA